MHTKQEYKYLKFTDLTKTVFWDYYTLSNKNAIFARFELVKLKQVLNHRKEFITISDNVEYKRCRVQIQGKGVVLRDEIYGKEIKTKKQQVCKTDDFLVAEIDAKVGGYGIVHKEMDGAVVSGHYFLFEIDKSKLLPEFLGILVKFEQFSKQVKSTGSTNYAAIRPYHVLDYLIPLPTLLEQESIVNNYYSKIKEAEELEKQANDLEVEFEQYLFDRLGYKNNLSKAKLSGGNFIRFIDYSNIDKWGVDKLLTSSDLSLTKSFEIKKIREICSVSSGGTPSRNRKEYFTGNIPWIKTGEVINEVIFDTEEKISDEAIENSSAKVYPKGSLIIAMYGQGLTRGRTAKLGIDASTNQACAVLYNIDNNLILTDYLWVYLMGEYNRLREMASGNNQPNLNAQMIKDYKVIIPPYSIQNQIIKAHRKFKTEKLILITNYNDLIVSAEQEFEQTIFAL